MLDPDAHFGFLLAAAVGGRDHLDDEIGAEVQRSLVVGRELGDALGGEPGDIGKSAAEVSRPNFGVCAGGLTAGCVGPVRHLHGDVG